MSSSPPFPLGIVSTADQTRPGATYLPLEALNTHVFIVDVSARVVLSQLYFNDELRTLNEAHYVFPIPARAAVCSFEVRTQDGRRLKGIVKDIAEAKEEYKEANRQGRMAGLLEQAKQDVFSVGIGTIPPRTHVTVLISYVIDLSEDDQYNTVRFQLPQHVGARYGAPPTSALYHGTAHRARVSITVEVEMASAIGGVTSPTHADIEHVPRNASPDPSTQDDRHARVRWASADAFLDKDFLLVVQAAGLDVSRCLSESLSPSDPLRSRNGCPETALALTVVPRFDVPTISAQEYIFLIDRSGSMMNDAKIDIAKETLGYMLATLPRSGTKFNVFSFGSQWTSLWPRSEDYNESTLRDARQEVQAMQADMGGTKLLPALTGVFSTRSAGIHTSIFVLTDGEIWQPKSTIEYVRQMVHSAPVSWPLRVFTLGVGDAASSALCQGIADAGRGACLMALKTEDLMLKSVRLLNAMQVVTVEALWVDWNVPDPALQAPDPLLEILPGVRTVVTAVIAGSPPTEVVLRSRLSDGSALAYRVPVVRLSADMPSIRWVDPLRDLEVPPLLHTLAAHRYIQGLERQMLPPSGPLTGDDLENRIVALGTQYQVASSRTAFVAVDVPRPPKPARPKPSQEPKPTRSSRSSSSSGPSPSPKTSRSSKTAKSSQSSPSPKHSPPKSSSPKSSSPKPSPPKSSPPNPSPPNPLQSSPSPKHSPPKSSSPEHSPPKSSSPKHSPPKSSSPKPSPPKSSPSPGHSPPEPSSPEPSPPKHSSPEASSPKPSPSPKPSRSSKYSETSSSWEDLNSDRQPHFCAYDPPVDTATQEVVIIPNPQGGNQQIICTAPPPASITSWFPGRSFLSQLVFRPVEATQRAAALAWQTIRQTVGAADVAPTRDICSFSRLQAAEGMFSLGPGLYSAVGVSEERIRSSMPSDLVTTTNGSRIWATAVAVAFLRWKYARYIELWGITQVKAKECCSELLADGEDGFERIVEAARSKLFSP